MRLCQSFIIVITPSLFPLQEAYNNLKKILASKWDSVLMQAEEQVRLTSEQEKVCQKAIMTMIIPKERKKGQALALGEAYCNDVGWFGFASLLLPWK